MGYCNDQYVKRAARLILDTLRDTPEFTFDAEFGDVDEVNERLKVLIGTEAGEA